MATTSSTTLRVSSMLKLDFYRLFHTPAFYIMLGVSAIIPALILSMAGTTPAGGASTTPALDLVNTWQLIERAGGAAAASPLDFAGYANINMVFIFAGLLVALFVASDYSSGFVKTIFTAHARKLDYVISKTAIGVFGGVTMIVAYLIGAVAAGLITGKSFEVAAGGLVLCLLSKMLLMAVFCSLFLVIAVFFRNQLWWTIVFTFLLGMVFYPAASVATLASTSVTLVVSLAAGAAGALVFGAISALILNHRDLA